MSFLVWSLYGLVRVVQFEAYYLVEQGGPVGWGALFSALGLPLVMWAVLSPCILAVALRWPLRAPGLLRSGAVHGGLFVTVLLVESCITAWWTFPAPRASTVFITTAASILPSDFLSYMAIVAIARVLVHKRSLLEVEAQSLLQRAARERSESMALRMQLHPHFIMNALQAVAELIEEDPAAAEAMVVKLEEMVAQTQAIGRQEEVPLTWELELVETYLAIQRFRLGARLQVELDVEEGLGDVLVPGFVLQPLVENAVVHGVSQNSEGGIVRIQVSEEAGVVRLEVLNGCPERVGGGSAPMKEGTGLRNTRLRLSQLYGSAHTLRLVAVGPRRMRATLSVPLRQTATTAGQPGRLPGQGVVRGKEGELEPAAHQPGRERLLTQA